METCTLQALEHAVQRERVEVERRGTLGKPLAGAALEKLEGDLRLRVETKAGEQARVAAVMDKARRACRTLVEVGDDITAIESDHAGGPNRVDAIDWGTSQIGHVKHAAIVAASLLTKLGGAA